MWIRVMMLLASPTSRASTHLPSAPATEYVIWLNSAESRSVAWGTIRPVGMYNNVGRTHTQ